MDCKELILKNANYSSVTKNNLVKMEKGILIVHIRHKLFDMYTIKQIISCINYIHQKYPLAIPIRFYFPNATIIDKLSYIIFECICKSLIENFGHKIFVGFKFNHGITTQGILSSPLFILSHNDAKNEKYLEKFNQDVFRYHYRRVLNHDEYNSKKINQIYDDVFNFQKSFDINYECIDKITEVVVELICNSIEHANSDCLIDIDLAPNYINSISKEPCCGINIVVLNISDILLSDKISEKIENYNNLDIKEENRYSKVLDAFEYHKNKFSDNYDKTDFFNIVAFQHKISGRERNYTTGGTGLTLLIKSIEERADAHSCYALSGDRTVSLIPEYLGYDRDNWLGFNSSNDFFQDIPDKKIINRSKFFFTGTAYNLNFIMKVNKNAKIQ